MDDGLRVLAAALLALATAVLLERRGRQVGLEPHWGRAMERRAAALGFLTLVLFVLFLGLVYVDRIPETVADPTPDLPTLFALQGLLLAALAVWFGLGWGRGGWSRATRELGLRARRPLEEVSVGFAVGIPAWAVALGVTALVAAAWRATGGALPGLEDAATERIAAVARLSVGTRLAISVTAGVVEELFFRGFVQKRLGVFGATALFVVAHVGYGQVFLLIGVAVLSTIFGFLVRWRGNVWPAVVAHFVFDAIQLLVLIPWVLEQEVVATPVG